MAERVAQALNISRADMVDIAWADNGPGWVAVLLDSAEAVLAVRPGRWDLDIGVAGLYPAGSPAGAGGPGVHAGQVSTVEDPVTGSLNASLAEWLLGTGRLTAPYVASQGTAMGRRGRVRISSGDDGQVWVGGGTS